jgi:hypothetical protein
MQKERHSTSSSTNANKDKPKSKLKKVLLFGGIGIATLGVGYLLWRHFKPTDIPMDETDHSGGGAMPESPAHHLPANHAPAQQPAKPTYRPDTTWPLSAYMKGEKVKLIQKALNHHFKSGLDVDGYWGDKTEAALKANSQPNVIGKAQYDFLLAAMKKLGLAGLAGNIGKLAVTCRACLGLTQDGQRIPLQGGWLAGYVTSENADLAELITDGGNPLIIEKRNLIFSRP